MPVLKNNLGFGFFPGGAGEAPETEAFVARWATPPSAANLAVINDAVEALLAADVWDDLDVLVIPACAPNEADALLNWKSASFPGSPQGGYTFTAWAGIIGDGVDAYINAQFTPSTQGVAYQQDSACFGVFLTAGTDTSAAVGSGINSGVANCQMYPRFPSGAGQYFVGVNDNSGAQGGSSGTRLGLSCVNRSASNAQQFYRNGASVLTSAISSVAEPVLELYVLAFNSAGPSGFCANTCAAYFAGASLDATKQLAIYNAINDFLAAVPP